MACQRSKKILLNIQKDVVVIEDGNSLCNSMMKIGQFRESKQFCDVVLCVPKANKKKLFYEMYAHSCLLASASGLMHDILSNTEISSKLQKRMVFQDIEYSILKLCVDFIYGVRISVRHIELHKLKAAAQLLQIDSLQKHCLFCVGMIEKETGMIITENGILKKDTNITEQDTSTLKTETGIVKTDTNFVIEQTETVKNESGTAKQPGELIGQEVRQFSAPSDSSNNESLLNISDLSNLNNDDVPKLDEMDDDVTDIKPSKPLAFQGKANGDYKRLEPNHRSKPRDKNKPKRVRKYANLWEKNQAILAMCRLPRPCKHCGVMFKNYRSLRNHMKDVKGDVLYCQYCSKTFYAKSYLINHEKRHREEKNFHCDVCKFSAVTKGEIDWHKATHDKQPTAICELCGKSFKRKNTLKLHRQQIHGEVKDVSKLKKCSFCSYTHPSLGVLKYHMIRHQKIGTEVCTVCGKSYKRKHSLRIHMKVAHGTVMPKMTHSLNGQVEATQPLDKQLISYENQLQVNSGSETREVEYVESEYVHQEYVDPDYVNQEYVTQEYVNQEYVNQQLIKAVQNGDEMGLITETVESQHMIQYVEYDSNVADDNVLYIYPDSTC